MSDNTKRMLLVVNPNDHQTIRIAAIKAGKTVSDLILDALKSIGVPVKTVQS